MPDQSTTNGSLSGYLTVETGKIFQQRFCIIDSAEKKMRIYTGDPMTDPSHTDCLGEIDLHLVSMAKAMGQSGPKQKYENCFSITSLGDENIFKATSLDEMKKWVESINNECKITVPKMSTSSCSSDQSKDIGAYSMSIVAGVVHKTLIDSLISDDHLSSDSDSDDELPSEYLTQPGKMNVIKSGFAVKQGFFMKNWKRRFFILDDVGVSYFANESAAKPIRTIPKDNIKEARTSVGTHPSKGNLLELVTKERVFYLQVENAEEVKSWISAINACLSEDLIRNAEVQTSDSLGRNASLHVHPMAMRENSQSTASQTTDFLRTRQAVNKPLPNRAVQSYSTYL